MADGERGGSMDAADLSDIRKIRLIQAGQADLYEPIVRKYMRRAHSVAMQFVANAEDALELAQDAFLKTFRSLDRFDTTQRFFPWFHRILRNTCISHLRRKRLRTFSISAREHGGDDYAIEDLSTVPVEQALVGGELREEFWAAFRELSARDREILALRHFDDLQYQDIADALQIPIGTVMSRLFHARRRLRDRLAPLAEA
jgi:RNA polymerase sigma-70 factor, ECF subfamily